MLDRKFVHYIVALILLASLIPLQRNIDQRRVAEKLVTQEQSAVRPGDAAIGLLLAGFRGLAANMLWFRATVLFEQQRVTEEIPLFQAISYLQPRFRAMWSFGAWHMAYNVSAHFYDREDLTDEEVDQRRYDCFEIGAEFLRKGIKYNYYHYDLHWDLGFSILYYKSYKLIKEKGWPGEEEALRAALKEMMIASLFQPPLARHPPYVRRIIAIVMREGGMLDDAYRMWYRLKHWPEEDQNIKLVERHMKRVIENIQSADTKAFALDLENEAKLAEAYKVWFNLLTAAKQDKLKLAENKWSDPRDREQTDKDIESLTETLNLLEKALKQQETDVQSLQKAALEEGTPQAIRERIDKHFQALQELATEEHAADIAKTKEMYRELTKPAPGLDLWVLLFIPLLSLAAGYLIFGKELHAS
ncbi:hypothetical protein HQ563_07395 [bacterium]|nr:hypothetical protein [bacterium]